MKKEEYVKRREELLHEIRVINDQIRKLEIQYINESVLNQFTVGEKVRVIKSRSGVEYGFVVGAEAGAEGGLALLLKKCKKDGTMSKRDLNYIPAVGDIVEKIK